MDLQIYKLTATFKLFHYRYALMITHRDTVPQQTADSWRVVWEKNKWAALSMNAPS